VAQTLAGKVAIITGAGRGIGAATAQLFASEGARVMLAARSANEIERLAQELNQEFASATNPHTIVTLAQPTDVSDEAAVEKLFARTQTELGSVDILVNCAATIEIRNFIEMDAATWDEVMAVNVRGTFLCCRAAFKQMSTSNSKQGGAIVNLSSLSGVRGPEKFPGFSAYVVSKYGVVGLTEILAVEGKPLNIRVNCVAPGAVDTAMLKKAAPFLKTTTTPADVARTILYLADSQQSHHINGALLEIFSNA
jgi:NAD(P)-dependent dehydrogenase (short-subunit alcohol dehydrogenase family)